MEETGSWQKSEDLFDTGLLFPVNSWQFSVVAHSFGLKAELNL
jgi:hypothetical protein